MSDARLRLRPQFRVYCELLGGEMLFLFLQNSVVRRLRPPLKMRVVRECMRKREMNINQPLEPLQLFCFALFALQSRVELCFHFARRERVKLCSG